MIVLDTNVISELTRPQPDPEVVAWLRSTGDELYVTAVTVGELIYGIELLPDGRRRKTLLEDVLELLARFEDRVLPYDDEAARDFGVVAAHRDSIGRPIAVADAQIAAICRLHDAVCATRNIADFIDTGVGLMNPWTGEMRHDG